VGFRIDRQALRELRSDWSDSTTFLHSEYERQGKYIHVHWLKKDELCIVRQRKRGGCRFIRLKEDKRLKRESSDAHE